MLKVPIILLLCGLFPSPHAQLYFQDLTERFIRDGFLLATVDSTNFQRLLKKDFFLNFYSQNLLGGLLSRVNSNVEIQVKNSRLLQVYLEVTSAGSEGYLRLPLGFSIFVQLPHLNSFTFNVRSDIQVHLIVENDAEDRHRLIYRSCRLLPQYVQIQPENLFPLLSDSAIRSIERALRISATNNLGEVVCPVINRTLTGLDPQEVDEIIYVILQSKNDQVTS